MRRLKCSARYAHTAALLHALALPQANGCLHVLPGSHRRKQLAKHTTNTDPRLVRRHPPSADRVPTQCLVQQFVSDSLCFGTRTRQCRRIKIDRNKKQTATRFTIRDTEPRNTHRTADYFTHAEITGREAHTQRECRCLDGASTYVSFQALEQEFSEWGKDYHESDAVAIEMKAGQVRAHKSSESRIRESENLLQQR